MSLETILRGLGLKPMEITNILPQIHLRENTFKAHLQQMKELYGIEDKKLGQLILRCPQFARYDHHKVIHDAVKIYHSKEKVKKAILTFPQFAGLDHARIVLAAVKIYGDEERVKKCLLKFPQFAGLNHFRIVYEATLIYHDEEQVKEAILRFPEFASLDHPRVVRQRKKLARFSGLDEEEVIDTILHNPVFASYSAKRYIAGMDICRKMILGGYPPHQISELYFKHIRKSPYVPGTERKRISQVAHYEEPPLMKQMKKVLQENES